MQINVRTLARSGALFLTAGVFAVSATLVPVQVATAASADDPSVTLPKKVTNRLTQMAKTAHAMTDSPPYWTMKKPTMNSGM